MRAADPTGNSIKRSGNAEMTTTAYGDTGSFGSESPPHGAEAKASAHRDLARTNSYRNVFFVYLAIVAGRAFASIPRDGCVPVPAHNGNRLLTAAEFQRLAEVPAEVEWFANIRNACTRRAYENAIKDFMLFSGTAES